MAIDEKSYNDIRDLDEDWALDDRNNLPYSGKSVQKFIKKGITAAEEGRDRRAGAAYYDIENFTTYYFKDEETKLKWLAEGRNEDLVLFSTEFVFTSTLTQITILNKMGGTNLYFTTTQEKAELTVGFLSQQKGITDTSWEEINEDFYVSVAVDKGAKGSYENILEEQLVLNGNDFTVDTKKYLATGANRVKITARGADTGTTKSLVFTTNLTTLYIKAANFTWGTPFVEGATYRLGGLNIGGNLEKTFHLLVSGNNYEKKYEANIGIAQFINTAYYFTAMEFPTGGTGVYTVEMWVTGNSIESEHLVYNIMCVANADKTTAQLVAISNVPTTVINYTDNKLFDYAVYDRGNAVASPNVLVEWGANVIAEETLTNIPTAAINSYELGIEIDSQDADLQISAEISMGGSVQSATYTVDNSLSYPPTPGYSFYLNPAARNNKQENRELIINAANDEAITATWQRMAWSDGVDGWTVDDEGRKCLFIPARSKCVIDFTPLAKFSGDITFEFCYKVKNVVDYTEPVITICDDKEDFIGLRITPDNILAHSALSKFNLTQGINIQDEVAKDTIITIIRDYKVTYGNLCQIYVDSGKARSFEFDSRDTWNTNAKLTIGSDTSDTYLYKVMVYNRGFEKEDAERNAVASLASPAAKKALHELINSVRYVDAANNISTIDYYKMYGKYNTMEIEMLNGAELPHKGLSKEYSAWCNVEFSFVDLPSYYKTKVWKFILEMCKIEGQGTTSMNYWLWNLRFRIDKSGNIVIVYPDGQEITLI